MTAPLPVADMASYLEATGWRRQEDTWRGASLWDHGNGYQALVPARDGLADAADRTWELLNTLSAVEGRPADDIADDIASPQLDTPFVRTFPAGLPSGEIRLAEAIQTLDGVRGVLAAAGRAEFEGVRPTYSGKNPAELDRLLREIRLGPSKPGSYVFTLRANVAARPRRARLDDSEPDEPEPLVRRTLKRLFRGVTIAHAAASAARDRNDYLAFDGVVADGLSTNMCRALADLGGAGRQQPFEIGFRWARALPSDLPARSIRFGHGDGAVLHDAARQLEQLLAGGQAQITGLIESLHDEPQGDDRWRIRIRGQLTTEAGLDPARPVWVRLDAAAYDRALDAHRRRRSVRARGRLRLVQRRVELHPDNDGFQSL
jgi:hypothetical protein